MLKPPKPPIGIQLAFERNFAKFLRPGDPSIPDARRGAQPAQQVFTIGLESLAGNQPLPDGATLVSWRFLISARSGYGLYATVSSIDGGPPEVTDISRGPKAAVAVQANQDVKKLPEAQARDYNPCILLVPGLLTECFWLKWISNDSKAPPDPKQDLIVPFVTPQHELMPMRSYSIEQFSGIAGPLAKERLGAFERLREEETKRAAARRAAAKREREALLNNAAGDNRPRAV